MKIGNRLRDLRKSKKMTLRELSEASGVALATLSRIETNKMTGTVKSHQAIASSLGIDLSHLYSNIRAEGNLVEYQSKKNRTDQFIHNDKASYNILTNDVLSKKMMPVIQKVSPGGASTIEELPKQTEKFIYILKGECEVYVGSESYVLKKGETLYFDASLRHYFKNAGHEDVQAICIITPPAL